MVHPQFLLYTGAHVDIVTQGKDDVAEQGRVSRGDKAEPFDAEVVEYDVEEGPAHRDVHGELVLVIKKLDVGEGCIHKGKNKPDRHRRDDVDRLVVFGGSHNAHDLGRKGGEHEGAHGHSDENKEEHIVQFFEFPLLQLFVLPGDQGIVDALGHDLHDHGGVVGHAVEACRRDADHLLDHDPVKLVQDVLGDVVHQQRNVEKDGEFGVLLFEPNLSFSAVVDKEADAEDHVDQHAGEDAGVALLFKEKDGRHSQPGVEEGHQQGAEDDSLIDVFVSLAYGPEINSRREEQLREDRHHDKCRQLSDVIDLPVEDQINQEHDEGQHKGGGLHGGGVSVPVVPELDHSLVEHSVVQTQGDENRKNLEPRIVDSELSVLFGAHQPCEDGCREHGHALLQDAAENEP